MENVVWRSQLGQDAWVSRVMRGKRNGIYVDIGAGDPFEISNTAALNIHFGWQGILCDIEFEKSLATHRPDNRIFGDAFTVDWRREIESIARDGWIDYLSLDLEPPELATRLLADRIPLDTVKYRMATIEHDLYRDGKGRKDEIARLMTSSGYVVVKSAGVVDDRNRILEIEDWWMHGEYLEELIG